MIRTPLGGFINHEKTVKESNGEGKEVEVSGPNCKRIRGRMDGCKIEYSLITRRDIKAGEDICNRRFVEEGEQGYLVQRDVYIKEIEELKKDNLY